MKVIDVLNMISKGEDIPHFKIDTIEYFVNANGFITDQWGEMVEWTMYSEWLNEEVTLLEEPKKIEPFTQEEKWIYHNMSAPIDDLVHKVSLIIDYINRGNDE